MENKENIVEVIQGDVSNRNQVTSIEVYNKMIKNNTFKNEMYRSYYSFDETFYDYVKKNNTVKGFNGLTYINTIVLDIDKGDISDEAFNEYLYDCLDQLEDLTIDKSYINIWFSGSGYHVELLNVFGFQPSRHLHEKVRLTMKKHIPFADTIFDKTRIIRSKWSLNTKTGLYKVFIPYDVIRTINYETVRKIAKSRTAYDSFRKEYGDDWFHSLHKNISIQPHLQKLIESSPTVINNVNNRQANASAVVTCMQHVFNEGPTKGSRNMKLMRMSSSYKRAGIPYVVTLNGMLQWSNGSLDDSEVIRSVNNIYDGSYKYGCNDTIMSEYCDPKCIYFKRKDYTLDIKTILEVEDNFRKYVNSNMDSQSINLADIWNVPDYLIRPGELVVFSGDTGIGKSTFVQNIVTKFDKETLFLSLEMPEALTFRRFVQIANKKSEKWVYNQYKSNPNVSFEKQLKHINIMTIAPELGAIKKAVAQYEPKVLVIDTLDELHADYARGEIEKQNAIIAALKEIAQKYNTIVFAVHHINKASAASNTFTLHSLKGSSNVVQKADKVIMIKGQRDELVRHICSEKSRDEGKFNLTCTFNPDTMTFTQYDWSNQ